MESKRYPDVIKNFYEDGAKVNAIINNFNKG